MAAFTAAFNSIIAKTPLSATFTGVGLPVDENEPLVTKPEYDDSAKCELRIEGMTCGSCVEVRVYNDVLRN
jgi:Cu+-exporting ATPase